MTPEQKVENIIAYCKALDERNSERMMAWLKKEMNKLSEFELQLLERELADLGIAIGG